MPYEAEEISVSEGRPIELYQFETEGTVYRFSNTERVITKDAIDFLPAKIRRDNVEQSNKAITGQFKLQFALRDPVTTAFLALWIPGPPETDTVATIFKQHVGDVTDEFITFWQGKIRDIAFKPKIAELLMSNVGSFFSDKGPRLSWGGHCGAHFGDDLCLFQVSTVTRTLTVSAVSASGTVVTIADLATGQTAGDYIRGEMRKGAFARRYITDDNLPSNQITLLYPLPGLAANDVIEVVEGCPHNITACEVRFANSINYIGTPYTPNINPFERSLDKV